MLWLKPCQTIEKSKTFGKSASIFTVNGHKEGIFQRNMDHFYNFVTETQDEFRYMDGKLHLYFPSVFYNIHP